MFFYVVFAFAQYTPSTVPNTKLVNNSYVSNPDQVISESAVAQIDSTLLHLEQQTTVQVAVVVLRSIGDADEFNFAQELYNLWGIGNANSNGLLVLVVEDRHILRFHTGLGLEGVLPDATCKDIHRRSMIPSFKEGDYDSGLINGINDVAKILTDPSYAEEIKANLAEADEPAGYASFVISVAIFFLPIFLITWAAKSGRFADSKEPDPTRFARMRLKKVTWLILFGGVPILIVLFFWIVPTGMPEGNAFWTLYLYLEGTVFFRMIRERLMIKHFAKERQFFEIVEYYRQSVGYYVFIAFVFPLPMFFYLFYHLIRKRTYRNHSRQCKLCNGDMKRIKEKDEDQFLTKTQQVEEELKSVDYDVWLCKGCGASEAWHFRSGHSSYKECPRCKAIAYYPANTRTLESATYSKSGKGELTYECKACNHKVKSIYTIDQLTHSTSSSSSSSSGGSSWGSSSSSSSGGSWGGGRSGGGGASSSW